MKVCTVCGNRIWFWQTARNGNHIDCDTLPENATHLSTMTPDKTMNRKERRREQYLKNREKILARRKELREQKKQSAQ